jgi:hypothetical protein
MSSNCSIYIMLLRFSLIKLSWGWEGICYTSPKHLKVMFFLVSGY